MKKRVFQIGALALILYGIYLASVVLELDRFGKDAGILPENALTGTRTERDSVSVPNFDRPVAGFDKQTDTSAWKRYHNNALGISLLIPPTSVSSVGCSYSGDSYALDYGQVPVAIFELSDGVYVAPEYEYRLGAEGVPCERASSSPDDLKKVDRFPHWRITVKSVVDQNDIDSFIKATYGDDCSFAGLKETSEPDTFDVRISPPGPNQECFLNFALVLKYNAAQRKIAHWIIGQDHNFGDGKGDTYDSEMKSSFRFER